MSRIEKIMDFLRSSPGDSFLQHALALEYIKLGNDEEAGKLFEEIVTRDPGYIGTYYHLAKLLERREDTDSAVKVYRKGMEEAAKAGDQHALAELKAAYEELTF